jgi:hypothetical protein
MTLTQNQIKEILKNEKEIFNGDRRAACAAHFHTVPVVMKTGFREPVFTDEKAVSDLADKVTKYVDGAKTSKKATKKKSK